MLARIALAAVIAGVASPAAADFCTDMSGAAKGLCNAYCHGIGCGCVMGVPDATSTACSRVRERLLAALGVAVMPWEARATLSGFGTIQVGESLRTLTITRAGIGYSGSAFGTFTWTTTAPDGTVETMNCAVDQVVPPADASQSWCLRGACDLFGYWASFSIRDSRDANVADALCGLFADAQATDCYRSPLAYSLDFIPIVSGDFTTEFVP